MTVPMTQIAKLAGFGNWPTDVDVWLLTMSMLPTADAATSPGLDGVPHLDAAERARAAAFRRPADRWRFALTRAALRERLAAQVDRPAAALRFVTEGNGRPVLADEGGPAGLTFNVSHSGDRALLAISRRRRVGVDIEAMRAGFDWRELTSLVCTPDEVASLAAMDDASQYPAFLRCWTAKEAVLKALGLGIAEGLRAIGTAAAAEPPFTSSPRKPIVHGDDARFAAARDLAYGWLDVPGDYTACLAFEAKKSDFIA